MGGGGGILGWPALHNVTFVRGDHWCSLMWSWSITITGGPGQANYFLRDIKETALLQNGFQRHS